MKSDSVNAVNRLTARWAATVVRPVNRVFSGAGVWPLLGVLAIGAAGAAREELLAAFGVESGAAATAVREVMALFDPGGAVRAASAVWWRRGIPIEAAWVATLPPGVPGEFSGDPAVDGPVLDSWAGNRTGGLIRHLPVRLNGSTRFVLASVLAVDARWQEPFRSAPARSTSGPWAGRDLLRLSRETDLAQSWVVDAAVGPLTVTRLAGVEEVDVYLLLGHESAGPASILQCAIDAVEARLPASQVTAEAPGTTVTVVPSVDGAPRARLECAAFAFADRHDLLADASAYGLAAASQPGHYFPGISAVPLPVTAAAQDAMVEFSALGFRAVAVSVIASAMSRPGEVTRDHESTLTTISYDRPFAFVATHRPSGLVLAAGWVAEPAVP